MNLILLFLLSEILVCGWLKGIMGVGAKEEPVE